MGKSWCNPTLWFLLSNTVRLQTNLFPKKYKTSCRAYKPHVWARRELRIESTTAGVIVRIHRCHPFTLFSRCRCLNMSALIKIQVFVRSVNFFFTFSNFSTHSLYNKRATLTASAPDTENSEAVAGVNVS